MALRPKKIEDPRHSWGGMRLTCRAVQRPIGVPKCNCPSKFMGVSIYRGKYGFKVNIRGQAIVNKSILEGQMLCILIADGGHFVYMAIYDD